MADILIRGMEMPKEAEKIIISADGSVWSNAWPTRGYMRMKNVYAVPLPEGHGRLGDLDALEAKLQEEALQHTLIGDLNRMTLGVGEVIDRIRMAKTIVPAEGGGENEVC